MPPAAAGHEAGAPSFSAFPRRRSTVSPAEVNALESDASSDRLASLELILAADLMRCAALFEVPIFTTALLAGDAVVLHALHAHGLLRRVDVVVVDTLHLFAETYEYLAQVEEAFGFEAKVYRPAGLDTKADWDSAHGSDLYIVDAGKYDQLAKVEPLQRAIEELEVDLWINGRRRDHGAERAALPVFETGSPVKANVLAHWTFRDVWDYVEKHGVPVHPLHAEGFPSVGDVHSTVPVPNRERWFEYGGERLGRFQGLSNPDGTAKTECGIHSTSSTLSSGPSSGYM